MLGSAILFRRNELLWFACPHALGLAVSRYRRSQYNHRCQFGILVKVPLMLLEQQRNAEIMNFSI